MARQNVFCSTNVRVVPLAVLVLVFAACNGSREAVSTPSPTSTSAETTETGACGKFEALKAAFPEASEVAFTERESIGPYGQRGTAWPGRCAGWRTTYSVGSAEVEIAMTLYKTHKQALTALAEPALGPVEKLSNGALVRKRRGRISIAGVPARHWLVASVYRNVFSISTSTAPSSTADKPISLSAQIALHRRFHEGVLALG